MSVFASPRWQRLRMWVSYSVTSLFVLLLSLGALSALAVQIFFERSFAPPVGVAAGSIVMAIFMGLSEEFYMVLARKLTLFENHRVSSTFQVNLGFKTFFFHFFLNSSALYFVAFLKGAELFRWIVWLRQYSWFAFVDFGALCTASGNCCAHGGDCVRELEALLLKLIVTKSIANLLKTYLAPLILGLVLRGREAGLSKTAFKEMKPYQIQASKAPFKGTLPLYHHLVGQFSVLILFATGAPLAPLVALITNSLWLRNQAASLLNFHARPRFQEQRRGPVQWATALQLLIFVAISTNIALAFGTYDLNLFPSITRIQIGFLLEHVALFVWMCIFLYIPKIPGKVRKALASARYAEEQVLSSKKKRE